jgi:hypothetical protein
MLRQLVLTAERTVTRAGDMEEVLTAELRLENRDPGGRHEGSLDGSAAIREPPPLCKGFRLDDSEYGACSRVSGLEARLIDRRP